MAFEFKELLIKSLREKLKTSDKPIAVLLSGGCDSTAIFFCLLEMKIPFSACTYFLEKNKDYENAKKLSEHYSIDFHEYKLNNQTLIDDLYFLKYQFNIKGKVFLQTFVGYLEIFKNLTDHYLLDGSIADILYGSMKSIYLYNSSYLNKEEFIKRRKYYLEGLDISDYKDGIRLDGLKYLRKLSKYYGNEISFPFVDRDVINYFLEFDFKTLNRPKLKKIFYDNFMDLIPKTIDLERSSQQISSGVRKYLNDFKISYR